MHIEASHCDISEHEGKKKVGPTNFRETGKEKKQFSCKDQESEYQWASQQPQ